MKRLLMIIPFFPPMAGGGVHRPLSFVRYLSRYGWEPTVVAPRGDAYWIGDDRLLDRVPASVDVVRTSTLSGQALLSRFRRSRGGNSNVRSSRRFALVRRAASALLVPDTYVGWYPSALQAARRLMRERSFDAIYSTSPPETSHLVARSLARGSGLPWLADFRDPWMNLHLLDPPTRVHAALHRRLEAAVCREAFVTVTTDWHAALLSQRYPHARVTKVSNGYDAEEIGAVEDFTPPRGRMRVMHAGMLTQTRTSVPFLRALHRFLEGRPEARDHVEVVFAGPREDENDQAAAKLGLSDVVSFRDSIPHDEALRAEKESHVLLLIKHDNPAYTGLVPGKLFEYIGLGRPILALAPPGEARDLVVRLGRGEVAGPADVDAVAGALERMYDRYRAGTLESSYDLSPRPELDRACIAGNLAAVLDGMVRE